MDRDAVLTRFGGDVELVGQLIGLFVAECPRMMDDVRVSVESGSAEGLRQSAHSFKGCVANFLHAGAVEAAKTLETMGREGRMAEAHAGFVRLEREVDDLLRTMQECETRGGDARTDCG